MLSARTSSVPLRRRRLSRVAVACVFGLLLVPAVAHAQAIGGTVTDTTGGVLPGVTVEARSPALIEQVRTAITDGSGQYLIVALETGSYTVTFSLPGFSTLVREGVELSTGFTANVDGELAVGALSETVTVTEATPTIDVQSVRQSETIDRDIFEVLPTTRGYDSLALLIPAMNIQGGPSTAVPIDTGGLSGVPNNRLTIHGSDEYDAEVHVDGFDVNSVAFDGAPGALPQDAPIAEYVYDYSSNAAEVETGGVRMNMIPKEGSNTFTGGFYANYGHADWLWNNVDQDLIDRGITGGKDGAFKADQTWQVAPSLGGPLVRDNLWFFGSYTYRRASFFPSGLFNNTDTSSLTYLPDLDDPTLEVSNNYEYTLRLTWQATTRDKVQVYYANSNVKQTPALTGSQLYPLYIAPEAGSDGTSAFNTYQISWVRPQTDRILFEAGYSRLPAHSVLYPLNNDFGSPGNGAHFGARTDLPGLLEISNLTMSRNMGGLFQGNTVWYSTRNQTGRASMSYVTGSHNLKFGFRTTLKWQNEAYQHGAGWTNLQTFFGFPVTAVFVSRPPETNQLTNTGIYAQDQWTIDRLTINAGLRFDYFKGFYPDHVSSPGQPGHSTWVPHPIMIDGATAATWKDLQPRLGVVYDLRGDGRTALKVSASRFGSRDSIALAGDLNPIANNTTHTWLWGDGAPFHLFIPGAAFPPCFGGAACVPGDGLPQGDPTLPYPNGELIAPTDNVVLGAHGITQRFDPDWAFGWGAKKANWEFSGSVQHELFDNVSLDVGYFRRSYINFDAWDNLAVGPGDFQEYTITVPQDTRLPDGGGYPLTVVDMTPEAFARAQDNVRTGTDELGGESEMWQGVDVSVSARVENFLMQGGVATGRRVSDYCGYQAQQPEVIWGDFNAFAASRVGRGITGQLASIAGSRGNLIAKDFCRAEDNWLTNLSLSGSYTFPYDIDVSAAFFSRPGPRREAIYAIPPAEAAAALGRPTTVQGPRLNILPPGTVFGDTLNQMDLRFAKLIDLGTGGNLRASFDIYNLFNANAVSREQAAFGAAYLTPIGLQPGRLAKVSFQFNF